MRTAPAGTGIIAGGPIRSVCEVLGVQDVVAKSLNNLFTQIIDDKNRKTLVSASSIQKEIKKNKAKKIEKSVLIGEILAKRAKEKNISNVYLDRGEYKYHGRIKAFAEILRKNGLKF